MLLNSLKNDLKLVLEVWPYRHWRVMFLLWGLLELHCIFVCSSWRGLESRNGVPLVRGEPWFWWGRGGESWVGVPRVSWRALVLVWQGWRVVTWRATRAWQALVLSWLGVTHASWRFMFLARPGVPSGPTPHFGAPKTWFEKACPRGARGARVAATLVARAQVAQWRANKGTIPSS